MLTAAVWLQVENCHANGVHFSTRGTSFGLRVITNINADIIRGRCTPPAPFVLKRSV